MDDASDSWPSTDQTTTPGLDSSGMPSGSSSRVPPAHSLEWDLDPSSLHLVDMKKFETITDSDGEETVPRGRGVVTHTHTYPSETLGARGAHYGAGIRGDHEDAEGGLTEAVAEEAIREGEGGEIERVEREEREVGS